VVSPDTSTVYGELTDLSTKLGSLCIEAVIDCLRAISDGMIGVECRHTNFNSCIQIEDHQYNSSAITHFRLSEAMTPLCGTLGFRGTQSKKRCFILVEILG